MYFLNNWDLVPIPDISREVLVNFSDVEMRASFDSG
jgi:hypothetical protein